MSEFDDTRLFDATIAIASTPVAILSILAAAQYYTILRIGFTLAIPVPRSEIDIVRGTSPGALTGFLFGGLFRTVQDMQVVVDFGPDGLDLGNAEGLFFNSDKAADRMRGWVVFKVNNGPSAAP